MNIRTLCRKSISIILCISILASLIVMGTFSSNAEAVAGTYSFRVKWQCADKGGSYNTGYSYDGDRADNGKNYVGFTVFYKNKNGTDVEQLHVDKDLGGSMNSDTDDHWVEWTNVGFPTGLFSHNDHGNLIGTGELKIKELQVKKNGAADSAYTTVWSGTIRSKSNTDIKEAWIYCDGEKGTFGKDGDDTAVIGSGWSDKMPKPTTVTYTKVPSSTTIVAPKQGEANKSLEYQAKVDDQYGVAWGEDPSFSLASEFYGVSIDSSTGILTITSDAHSNDASDTEITVESTSGTVTKESKLKIVNANYSYAFKDINGQIIPSASGSIKYGSVIPFPENPQKPYDENRHYFFKGWDSSDTTWDSTSHRIHKDTVFTPVFTPQKHDYINYESDGNATCTADGTKTGVCSCGKTNTLTDVGSRLPHEYIKETITPVTCEEDGLNSYTCVCGDYYEEIIQHQGHNYEYKTEPSKCEQKGYSGYFCSNCGDSHDVVYTEQLGHSWNDGVVVKEPQCEIEGEKLFTCTRCQATETRPIEPTGHVVKNWMLVSKPSCTQTGHRYGNCKTCKQQVDEYTPALGHDYGDGSWIVDSVATCDTEGRKHQICTRCGYENVEKTAALGHEFELIIVDPKDCQTGKMYYHCDVCKNYFTCVLDEQGATVPGEAGTKSDVLKNTVVIPTVEFNTYNRIQSNYDYSFRGAALKIDSSNGADEQSMRFCASMCIPDGAIVNDFGYVYSPVYTITRNLAIDKPNVTDVSLINGHHSTFNTDKGTVFTFNIVIPIKKENWDNYYYARPYIKFTYAGQSFTIYDDFAAAKSVNEIAGKVCQSPYESDATKDFFRAKIFGK